MTCLRCNVQGARRESQLSSNPERVYVKCMQCDEFLSWVDAMGQNLDAKISSEIQAIRKEFKELKMIEKGQSIVVMLLIAVIIVQSIVMTI